MIFLPYVEIHTTLTSPQRLNNALRIQSKLNNSLIVQGINGTNALYTFSRLNVLISEKYYGSVKHINWGKLGKWASILNVLDKTSDQIAVIIEDDIEFSDVTWDKLMNYIKNVKDWRKEPPFIRASPYNECLLINGYNKTIFMNTVIKKGIDNPLDIFSYKHMLQKRLPFGFNVRRYKSELLNSNYKGNNVVEIKYANNIITKLSKTSFYITHYDRKQLENFDL